MGDFNAHHPLLSSPTRTNTAGHHLHWALGEFPEASLLSDTSKPTHTAAGRLDLTLTSRTLHQMLRWEVHPTLTSDHYGILTDILTTTVLPPPPRERFQLRKADWGHFPTVLEMGVAAATTPPTLPQQAEAVTNNILAAARAATPYTTAPPRSHRDRWIYGPRIKEIIHRINAARKQHRRHPCPATLAYLRSVVRHAREIKM